MADDDDDGSNLITKLVICLIAAAAAAVVVTVYHCITTGHFLTIIRRSGRTEVSAPSSQPQLHRRTATDYEQDQQINNSSVENSLAELIPSHKYQKGGGGEGRGLVKEHDGMCPVCLSDFEEGEILRTLPECLHSYHAICIDMWLYSHSNCPMCRTNAAPSPITNSQQILIHLLESSTNHTSETQNQPQPPRLAFPLPLPATRHNLDNFRV